MRRLFIAVTLALSAGHALAQTDPPAEAPPAAEPAAPPAESAAPVAAPDAGVKKKRRPDAGAPDASASPVSPPPKAARAADAGTAAAPVAVTPPAIQSNLPPEAQGALRVAKSFFEDLLAGDGRGAAALGTFPFVLEERRFASADDLAQELLKDLRDKRTDRLTLYGIEMLTPAELEKKYGKPPARLVNFPYKTPGAWIAVANVSGRAAIAVLRVAGDGWRVLAYHD